MDNQGAQPMLNSDHPPPIKGLMSPNEPLIHDPPCYHPAPVASTSTTLDSLLKQRDFKKYLYQLTIQQLQDDGYTHLASEVQQATQTPPAIRAHDQPHTSPLPVQLSSTMFRSLGDERSQYLANMLRDAIQTRHQYRFNLDVDPSNKHKSHHHQVTPRNQFVTRFITTHKRPCTCASFSADGQFVITGSQDCSLKIISVSKMHYHTQLKAEVEDYSHARPVIRTFNDHSQEITSIACHPKESIICSASKDCTVKLFKYADNQKRAYKHIQETHPVRTVALHPGNGRYMLVGTDHHITRLYDLDTLKCFITSNKFDHHLNSVNDAEFSCDGKLWGTVSVDGSIKLWDGQNGRCINTIPHAHGKEEVYSCLFTKNSKYLLSNGGDGLAKLWDLRTGRQLRTYRPPSFSSLVTKNRIALSHDESFVIGSHESNVLLWRTTSGELIDEVSGHNKKIHCIASSPVEMAFVSCSEDSRARFTVSKECLVD